MITGHIFIITALAFACTISRAQLQQSSSTVTVIEQAATEAVPPKPPALTAPPTARLEINADPVYSRPLEGYLVQLFQRAERPRITEGDKFSFVLKTIITSPPEITLLKNGKSRFNPKGFLEKMPFAKGTGLDQLTDTFSVEHLKMMAEARCTIEIRLLNTDKDVVVQKTVEVVRTNTLQELSLELAGFKSGGAQNAADMVKNLSRTAVQQNLVNLTAYHAATNVLVQADAHFLAAASNPAPTPPANTAPPLPKHPELALPAPPAVVQNAGNNVSPQQSETSEWLTPAQAAAKLQMTEAEIIAALESNQIKGRKIGSTWRIQSKDL